MEAVAAGATGFLQKETNREQLLSALRNVVLGDFHLPTEIVRRAFEAIRGCRKNGRCRRRADSEGAGDTRLLRPGHVLRSDRGGEGD